MTEQVFGMTMGFHSNIFRKNSHINYEVLNFFGGVDQDHSSFMHTRSSCVVLHNGTQLEAISQHNLHSNWCFYISLTRFSFHSVPFDSVPITDNTPWMKVCGSLSPLPHNSHFSHLITSLEKSPFKVHSLQIYSSSIINSNSNRNAVHWTTDRNPLFLELK